MSRSIPKDSVKISEKFKLRLQKILDDYGYEKGELSEEANICDSVTTRMTVYGIIPTTTILVRLANCLNLPLEYLLGECDDKTFNESINPTEFYIRLEELKKEKKTTYTKISKAINFPDSYFYDWIKRKTLPSIQFLIPLSKYFQVNLDYLIGRSDERKIKTNFPDYVLLNL